MTFPLTVAPGATATITVAFTPTSAGARSGSVSIASNAPGSPHAVTLSGTGAAAPATLSRLSTSGAHIVDSTGATVRLKGVNWHGMEGSNHVPHVLWSRSYKEMLDQVAGWGFNCLRIPMSADIDASTMTASVSTYANPDLAADLSALGVLDKIIAYAGTKGLYVFLDCHRLTYGAGTDSAISGTSMAAITAFWQRMATRYGGIPTVCGADLYNEPYTVDWNTLAGYYETLGAAIHAIAPDWLIICEGNTTYSGTSYWWGGQLAGAASRPVSLTHPHKLVYSAHDYGLSVGAQTWLASTTNTVSGWPGNLDAVWAAAWAYLVTSGTAPVIIGEFGGKLGWDGAGSVDATQTSADFEKQWFSRLVAFMVANGVSSTFWTYTSQSGDTGGLLCDGDTTVQAGKIALLAPLLS